MENWEQRMEELAPEMMGSVRRRVLILQFLKSAGHAGRRTMAEALAVPERTLRCDLKVLALSQFISIRASGAQLSQKGEALLCDLSEFLPGLSRRIRMESLLQEFFQDWRFLVVPSSSYERETASVSGSIVGDWQKLKILDPQDRYRLQLRDAVCVVAGRVLSEDGHMVFCVSQEDIPSVILENQGTTAVMMHAALEAFPGGQCYLREETAQRLLQDCKKKGNQHA